MKNKYVILILQLLFSSCFVLNAQEQDSNSIFKIPIQLDAFVLKSGFDLNMFIKKFKSDTTFYKSFKSMHLIPYVAYNDIKIYNKQGTIISNYKSKNEQFINKDCRIGKISDIEISGDFYKYNGDYKYYTASLYDYLFFTHESVCNQNDIVAGNNEKKGKGQLEKSKYELKQLIFNPGSKIDGIPLLGNKASIFDNEEIIKYNLNISVDTLDNIDCYVFKIIPKKEYNNKVIYNELITWFDKNDFSILARNYSLSYHTLIYDFDVTMKVRLKKIGKKLYPIHINYDGDWHIFTKKREIVKFDIVIKY